MIGLRFTFPAGRYHATPWGRHVNEGDVAWPPEPYRILRTLIATWHRKADHAEFTLERLTALIDTLSEVDPIYRLPESVHAHSRHFMPQGSIDSKTKREGTKLVIDAFLRVDANDPLFVGWDVEPDDDSFRLLSHLAERLNYLGRAESIVIAETFEGRPSDFVTNACPRPIDEDSVISADPSGLLAVDLLAPIKASDWLARRHVLLKLNQDKAKSQKRKTFEETIPARLIDALSVDTADIQAAKWSTPPAGRLVLYDRARLSPTPRSPQRRASARQDTPPTVARFVLAGKPRPSIFDTLRIGETMRLAAMSKWRGERPPSYISGRDEDGEPLKNAEHAHAFWLPEDVDGDGLIDHIIVFARHGFDQSSRAKLGALTHLWIEHGAPNDDGERGRKEWRLALEGFGVPREFASESGLLKSEAQWRSVTPYLRPRFGPATTAETEAQIRRELLARGYPSPKEIIIDDPQRPMISAPASGIPTPVIKFCRTRSRHGLIQPDTRGSAVQIVFADPVSGPLGLGFGAHFGLGLFGAVAAA